VASLVKLSLNNGERLSMACRPLGFYLVSWEHLMEEAIEVRGPLVGQRFSLCHWIFIKLHDLEVERSRQLVSP
jgi:hypothetical protein